MTTSAIDQDDCCDLPSLEEESVRDHLTCFATSDFTDSFGRASCAILTRDLPCPELPARDVLTGRRSSKICVSAFLGTRYTLGLATYCSS